MQQTGQALGVAILGSICLSLASHSIPVGVATASGIQLAISVLFAMGSRFLPRFTGTASGRNGAMPAATPAALNGFRARARRPQRRQRHPRRRKGSRDYRL
jgi:hypothetical protein